VKPIFPIVWLLTLKNSPGKTLLSMTLLEALNPSGTKKHTVSLSMIGTPNGSVQQDLMSAAAKKNSMDQPENCR